MIALRSECLQLSAHGDTGADIVYLPQIRPPRGRYAPNGI